MPDNIYGSPYIAKPSAPNLIGVTSVDLGQTLQTKGITTLDDFGKFIDGSKDPNLIEPTAPKLSDVQGDLTGRYDQVVYGANNEDIWGAQQSILSKGVNGVLKGLNLAATTVAGGFGMVGGAIQWALPGGKLSDIWENPVMKSLDEWNNKVDQEYLPNYYEDKEKNADFLSTDNLLTANFLFDKLIKNSGYAVGLWCLVIS